MEVFVELAAKSCTKGCMQGAAEGFVEIDAEGSVKHFTKRFYESLYTTPSATPSAKQITGLSELRAPHVRAISWPIQRSFTFSFTYVFVHKCIPFFNIDDAFPTLLALDTCIFRA